MDGQEMAAHTLSILFLQEVTGAGMAQLTLTFHPLLEPGVLLKVQGPGPAWWLPEQLVKIQISRPWLRGLASVDPG